jgi:simple sugar transport system permease protein
MPTLAGAVLLIVLYAAAAVRYGDQHFLTLRVFLNLLEDRAVLGILAVGMTFVIISGGIDLAVGAVMGLSSITVASLIMQHGWPAAAAIPAALLLGAAFGAAQGAVIHFAGLRAFIVTLAGMFLARGLGLMVSIESIGIADVQHGAVSGVHARFGELGSLRIGALIMLVTVAVGAYVATMTRFGRAAFALGGSPEAAGLMGLPVARSRIGVYALSGLCAAAGGVVLTFQLSSGSPTEGAGLELDAIAAAVIGGTLLTGGSGSIVGSLIGTLIIGLVLTVVTTYEGSLSSGMTRVLIAGLLLVFVVLQKALGSLLGAESAGRRLL